MTVAVQACPLISTSVSDLAKQYDWSTRSHHTGNTLWAPLTA